MTIEMTPEGKARCEMALRAAFGQEWDDLQSGKQAVLEDFYLANEDEGLGSHEYARSIGKGNLQSYANCLCMNPLPI